MGKQTFRNETKGVLTKSLHMRRDFVHDFVHDDDIQSDETKTRLRDTARRRPSRLTPKKQRVVVAKDDDDGEKEDDDDDDPALEKKQDTTPATWRMCERWCLLSSSRLKVLLLLLLPKVFFCDENGIQSGFPFFF